MTTTSAIVKRLGGPLAVFTFALTLFAFVAESQLTQYVQTTLAYRHPYFLFYIVHSSFWIIFPLHLAYLSVTTNYSASTYIKCLNQSIADQAGTTEFPFRWFIIQVSLLTLGITIPALLWFIAVSLASISDVTAIWNSNAFFAYVLSVKILHLSWQWRPMMAVVMATVGVSAVIYGSATAIPDSTVDPQATLTDTTLSEKPSAPLAGDILTLVASVVYGLYQVLYKKYVTLPSDPDSESSSDRLYEPVPDNEQAQESAYLNSTRRVQDLSRRPPFGLHPNFITSVVGLCTLVALWIPIPLLHYYGIEPFKLPENIQTCVAIAGIALTGVAFNAGFMILLGIWGPIVASVGNLLTIVLVFLSDIIFGPGAEIMTFWSVLGSIVIVLAFGILAYDMSIKS
ncbi:hypothetical protein AX16_009595 [Volvariella volvacea WC 439]|nr:hypothetical protein AX16_009595 [Volvariella volvacea WC 439]